jgi:hypothetical protein
VTERVAEEELGALELGYLDLQMMGRAVVLRGDREGTVQNWEGTGYRKRVMEG